MKIIVQTSLLVLITLCLSLGTSAATFVVNTTADTQDANAGDGVCSDGTACSFRAAISEANALAGDDIITLPAGAYMQTIIGTDENSNASGDWDLTSNITINGEDQATTFLQSGNEFGTGQDRVMEVRPGASLTLKNATVRYGFSYAPGIGSASGAGILSAGTLSLDSVTVKNNRAIAMSGTGVGGGIYNGGAMTLNNSTVFQNEVTGASPGGGYGGGIYSYTPSLLPIVITNSSITGNSVQGVGTSALGGGLLLDGVYSLTATGSHFDSNSTLGATDSQGAGAQLSSIDASTTFHITDCTFSNNGVSSNGGSGVGGGLHILADSSGAPLNGTLDKVTIDSNQTHGSSDGRGAGLFIDPMMAATNVDVTNSTISNNVNGGLRGGGVEISDRLSGLPNNSAVNFTNTTISGNSAGDGGGIHIQITGGPMTVNCNFVTIANNHGSDSGGGISHWVGNSTLHLDNSIIADNTIPTGPTHSDPDLAGSHNGDYNLIEQNLPGQAPHTIVNVDPQLGPLQNNGGPTRTQLPSQASSAVDSIPFATNDCGTDITADQRGIVRPTNTGCDRGAAEREGLAFGPWDLGGTVKTSTGIPIRNVAVTISGGNLPAPVTVFTGNLGTYHFANLPGSEYTVIVTAKRYHFNQSLQVYQLGQNIADADFVSNPPFEREVLIPEKVSLNGKNSGNVKMFRAVDQCERPAMESEVNACARIR